MKDKGKFDFLWSMVGANITASEKELREFLEKTGGSVTCRGSLLDVKSKHIGAGVYKVWLGKHETLRDLPD